MRQNIRPIIDIRRIPTGEKPLEELAAEVYFWIFRNRPADKASAGTFVNPEKATYNGGINTISGGAQDGTAT